MSESQNSYTEARQSKSADGMIPCIEKNHPCSDRKPDERSSEGGAGRQGKGQLIKRHEGIQGYSTYCGGIFTGVYIYIYISVTFTFHFHALEKKMATHSSVLAWRIPGTGEPAGLPSMGSHRVGHDWNDLAAAAAYIYQTIKFVYVQFTACQSYLKNAVTNTQNPSL